MTLVRGNIRGYEDDRMVLLFSMMDNVREVPCAVSASAMDNLEHVPGTPANQREAQFVRLRDRIEACAVRKFLAREFEGTPSGGAAWLAATAAREHLLLVPLQGLKHRL